MLEKFFSAVRTLEHAHEQFEELQEYNAQFGHKETLLSLLPVAYQQLSAQQTLPIDSRVAALAGGFLSHRYPHLKNYFVTERFKKDQAHMHTIIEEMSALSQKKQEDAYE